MRVSLLVAAVAFAASAMPAAAQSSLKPGLWEINNKMGGNPRMDAAMAQMQQQMAAMSPEQRKQMEAVMAQRGMSMPGANAGGGGMAVKICMTKDQVARHDMPVQRGCTVTQTQHTGNVTKVAFTCSSPPSSGEGEFTYMGPEAYASKMKMTTLAQGKQETMTMEGTGKWLGADCGNIQPIVPPKK